MGAVPAALRPRVLLGGGDRLGRLPAERAAEEDHVDVGRVVLVRIRVAGHDGRYLLRIGRALDSSAELVCGGTRQHVTVHSRQMRVDCRGVAISRTNGARLLPISAV